MPRITAASTSSSSGISIPWKGLAAVIVIVSALGYAWHQYEQLHPTVAKQQQAEAAAARTAMRNDEMFKAIGLTEAQKKKLDELASTTTSPQTLFRDMTRVLTPDQRDKLREEAKARHDRREVRLKRVFGDDVELAKEKDKQLREKMAQRRRDAAKVQSPGSTPIATPAPVQQSPTAGS